jgi:hypothetical protein
MEDFPVAMRAGSLSTCVLFFGLGFVFGTGVRAAEESVEYPAGGGQFNVKEFGAKGDGITDDTEAIRKAFKAVKMHFQVIYLPNGTYLVSDTINWDAWITLQGQSRTGTIIRLKDQCAAFGGKPKPVVRCLFNNNQSFSNYIRHLTIDTGKGNPGAIGVSYNAHNHGVLEHATIRSGDGAGKIGLDMSETEFGPGMVRHVSIEGFDVGIKTPGMPSNAVFEDITLKNQKVVGFDNWLPVTIRGLTSVNKVPAVRNNDHALALLVLLDADLSGGAGEACAIENKGRCYLRNVKASGYKAAVNGPNAPAGVTVVEWVGGETYGIAGSSAKYLNLPVKDPPATFEEPVAQWVSGGTSGQEMQKAMDGGAKTIFLPSNKQCMVSDTLHVPPTVQRIVGLKHHHGNIRGDPKPFKADGRPMLRIEGDTKEPLTIESVGFSAWPEDQYAAIEIASSRPVYLKYVWCGGVRMAPVAKGDLFIDEAAADLRLNKGQNVFLRQHNPENNPFDCKNPRFPRTYVLNHGANLWILGMKTEAPAIHVVTTDGGQTEVLGGFFRDHFGPTEYKWKGEVPLPGLDFTNGVPYFVTQDSSLSASYVQYAWAGGKARALQGLEIQGGTTKELRLKPDTLTVALYSTLLGNGKR